MTDSEEPFGPHGPQPDPNEPASHRALVRMALRISRLGAWQVDLPSQALTWSDEVRAILEVEPDITPTLEQATRFYDPEHRALISDAFARCSTDGTPFDLELQMTTATGRPVWVRAMGEAVHDDHGTVVRVQGAIQDISAQKAAEIRETTLTDRLASNLSVMSDAFFTLDRRWRFTFVNDAAETLLERRRQDLIGVDIWEAFPEAVGTISETMYRQAMDDRVPSLFETFYPPLEQWFEANAYPATEGIAVYFRSITDRVRRDAALRESEERFRLLSRATSDAIWDWNLVTDGLWWNDGFWTLFGFPRDEVGPTIESWTSRIHADDRDRVVSGVRSVIEGSGNEWGDEYRFRRHDGTDAWVVDRGHLIRDENGTPTRMIGGMTDVTERHRLEEELRQSQRLDAIGQLVGGVAHDFNNLLTVIMGNNELLVHELADDEDRRELATTALVAAQRGAELTQRLLAFARRQALAPRAVEVNGLVREMHGLLRRTLGEQIDIEVVRNEALWTALVDPAQLEGAILNLAINARDAMVGGGRMTIQTANVELDESYSEQHVDALPGAYVQIAVSDTGTGIAPEHLLHVFDPFFTTKASGRGTGLGLSMVYGFVKQSGGHARIYSEVGHGTTVRLYLPRAAGPAEAQDPIMPAAVTGGSEKILLVEDDELIRRYATDALTALGYRVLVAPDGPLALGLLKENDDIALLFTDVIMPGGMNGRELADAALAVRPRLRVLYTSGYTENAIVHDGRLDPDVRLLSKPYRRADLALAIRAALDD